MTDTVTCPRSSCPWSYQLIDDEDDTDLAELLEIHLRDAHGNPGRKTCAKPGCDRPRQTSRGPYSTLCDRHRREAFEQRGGNHAAAENGLVELARVVMQRQAQLASAREAFAAAVDELRSALDKEPA